MSVRTATVEKTQAVLHNYGLGLIFAMNVFGAGSVYILSSTGANYGMALLWVMPFALLVDLVMHEMSSRLAVKDEPLMEYILDTIGSTPARAFSVIIAPIMALWSVANYSVAGAALVWLVPFTDNVILGMFLMASLGIAMVELRVYDRIEAAITVLALVVFGSYLILISGLSVPVDKAVQGFVPLLKTDIGYLTMIIAMLGTTVYYPNLFIQSSMGPTKGWTNLNKYRKDNIVGITGTVILSIAVITVSAVTLTEGEMTLTGPGAPLESMLGSWALDAFIIAALGASFTSGTGTLFGSGFLVPQAWGNHTVFGDARFRLVVETLIAFSMVIAALMLTFTDFTPVRMAITMPAVNGIIGLPVTAAALWSANRKSSELSWAENIVFGMVTLLMFTMSVLTAKSLASTILSWI